MATSVVSQTQQVGQTVIDTWFSLFDKIYNNPFIQGLISLFVAIVLSLLLIFISRIISVFIRNKISKGFSSKDWVAVKKMWVLVGDIIFYAMAFLSIYISFTIAGIDIKLLMGWITIWVGFAFRQTLSNMISGIMIFSTSEYKLWNIIQLKMTWDIFGIIEEINMKNVIIRTFDMRRVVIPNASFLKKAIKTYSAEEFLRLQVEVVVDINMDIPLALEQTLIVVNELPFILNKQYTQALLDSFDDKKAKIVVQMFFNPNSWYSAEYIKSMVQVQLLWLYKKIMKLGKSSESPKLEVKSAVPSSVQQHPGVNVLSNPTPPSAVLNTVTVPVVSIK